MEEIKMQTNMEFQGDEKDLKELKKDLAEVVRDMAKSHNVVMNKIESKIFKLDDKAKNLDKFKTVDFSNKVKDFSRRKK